MIAEARGLVELHVHITSIRNDKGRSGLLKLVLDVAQHDSGVDIVTGLRVSPSGNDLASLDTETAKAPPRASTTKFGRPVWSEYFRRAQGESSDIDVHASSRLDRVWSAQGRH